MGLRRRNSVEVQGRRAGLQGAFFVLFLFLFPGLSASAYAFQMAMMSCVDTDLDLDAYATFTLPFAESDCEQCEEDALILELEA